MRKTFFLFIPVILSLHLSARVMADIPDRNILIELLDSTRKAKNDSIRLLINTAFTDSLYNYLKMHINDQIILDSVSIGNIVSDDGNIRILSWNIQQNNGDNLYSGFIVHKKLQSIIPLKLKKSEETVSEEKIYRDGDWPAGIYYRMIQRKLITGKKYTLLSWDGFNKRIARKSIEVLDFDEKGQAVFGAGVFKTKEGIRNRIVIEYSSTASFTMQYNRQKVILTGVRRSQRNINDEMIVFDRLVPLNEELTGQRWAYVPAGNTHDAFICFEGFWTFTEDIAARNEATPKHPGKRDKKPELDLLPKK